MKKTILLLALLAGFQAAWAEATLPAALDTRPGEPYVDAVLKATPALKIMCWQCWVKMVWPMIGSYRVLKQAIWWLPPSKPLKPTKLSAWAHFASRTIVATRCGRLPTKSKARLCCCNAVILS